MADYKAMSTKKLIEAYAFEAKRINEQDRMAAQTLIKEELRRRFNATLALLDDEQTTEFPGGTFNYLLGEAVVRREN